MIWPREFLTDLIFATDVIRSIDQNMGRFAPKLFPPLIVSAPRRFPLVVSHLIWGVSSPQSFPLLVVSPQDVPPLRPLCLYIWAIYVGLGNLGNTRSKLSFKGATTLEIGRLTNRGNYPTTALRFWAIEIRSLVYHFGPFPLIRSIFFRM